MLHHLKKIAYLFNFLSLRLTSLNNLIVKKQFDVRGLVNQLELSNKRVQIKSKDGLIWIHFWYDNNIEKNKRGHFYRYNSFSCRSHGIDINLNDILMLNVIYSNS